MRGRKQGHIGRYAPYFATSLAAGFDLQSDEDKRDLPPHQSSIFVEVFTGNIVFGHFVGVNFLAFMIVRALHA